MSRVLTNNFYGNVKFLSPIGDFLFFNNQKKANWYLSRDLAEIVEDPNHITVKFKFEPKGTGDSENEYLSLERLNRCVVCGQIENLTRHHVIPLMFKRHFSEEIKNHNSYDVFMICFDCHQLYEIYANELKKSLLNWKPASNKECLTKEEHKVLGILKALINNGSKMPNDVFETKMAIIKKFYGELDRFDLEELQEKQNDLIKKRKLSEIKTNNFEEEVIKRYVNNLENINDFIIMWREHFIKTMNPKFLPDKWNVNERF